MNVSVTLLFADLDFATFDADALRLDIQLNLFVKYGIALDEVRSITFSPGSVIAVVNIATTAVDESTLKADILNGAFILRTVDGELYAPALVSPESTQVGLMPSRPARSDPGQNHARCQCAQPLHQ